jgi:hypothetical protein
VSPRSFGIEAITDEDRAYAGSRFSDVREAVFANPYQRTWGADGERPLPVHPITLSSLLYGILPFGPPYVFRQATERAVDPVAKTSRRCSRRCRRWKGPHDGYALGADLQPSSQPTARRLRIGSPEPGDEQEGAWPRSRLIAMDQRFRERVQRAIARGTESRESAIGNPHSAGAPSLHRCRSRDNAHLPGE